jgi:hypothetical protein
MARSATRQQFLSPTSDATKFNQISACHRGDEKPAA